MPLATINFPKSPTFLGYFCKGVKIYHSSSEIIFGQLSKISSHTVLHTHPHTHARARYSLLVLMSFVFGLSRTTLDRQKGVEIWEKKKKNEAGSNF